MSNQVDPRGIFKGGKRGNSARKVIILSKEAYDKLLLTSERSPSTTSKDKLCSDDSCETEKLTSPQAALSEQKSAEQSFTFLEPEEASKEINQVKERREEAARAAVPKANAGTEQGDISFPSIQEEGESQLDLLDEKSSTKTTREPEIEKDNILSRLPDRYKQAAESTLHRLLAIPELDLRIDASGALQSPFVHFRGKSIGLTTATLLKILSVPFTSRKELPENLLKHLIDQGIVPRNHLLTKPNPPKWHPYFRF